MKILVVDDSNTARYVAVKVLRDLGYKEINAVGSAEEAETALLEDSYDLMILDWNMPQLSGYDFLKKIRANPQYNKLNVIMATTVNERNSVLQALKVGLQGYFFKPLQVDTIGQKLKEIESKIIASRTVPQTDNTPPV